MALQALAAYSEKTGGDQMDLRIEVSTDGDYKKTLIVNQKNALVQQQLDVSSKASEVRDSKIVLDIIKFMFNINSR